MNSIHASCAAFWRHVAAEKVMLRTTQRGSSIAQESVGWGARYLMGGRHRGCGVVVGWETSPSVGTGNRSMRTCVQARYSRCRRELVGGEHEPNGVLISSLNVLFDPEYLEMIGKNNKKGPGPIHRLTTPHRKFHPPGPRISTPEISKPSTIVKICVANRHVWGCRQPAPHLRPPLR